MIKKTFLILLLAVAVKISAQIERVEPAFWWVGMKNTELHLLVHGNEICNRQVVIDYQGVKVMKSNRACSPNYLFVTLQLDSKTVKAGKFEVKLKQPGNEDLSFTYELKNRRTNSSQRAGFTSADVVYLLMPDRFANGDSTNDSVTDQPEKVNRTIDYGRHGGDIKGIVNHLDYIKELGATTIWSTPLLENNYNKYTYHGYAISDFYKIDPRFGSNQDYIDMVAAAHKKGLKVIMDMVSNHCGIWAWWMSDLPFEDWIHQWPEFTRTNSKFSTTKDIHASEIDKKIFQDGWFDTTMPDMNQKNQYFWTYFIQNSIWWIENANLDGVRMDTYPFNDRDAMAKWAKAITDEYPDFNIVGEMTLNNSADIAFWQKNAVNSLHYNSQLPSVMDFVTQRSLEKCFNEHGKPWQDVGMNRLYDAISNDYQYANINNILVFFENHDTQRFNYLVDGDLAKYKLALSFIMTTRGIPQIYYGTEIGMTGNKDKGDGDIRRDFPGGWAGDSINAFTATGRTELQRKYFDFTSNLLNWRKNKEVIHTGLLTHYVPENDVYVYFRYNDKEKIMVILNNNETDQTLKPERYSESIGNYTKGVDVITGKTYDITASFIVPKATALILELNN